MIHNFFVRFFTVCAFMMTALFVLNEAYAAPTSLSYQGRIIGANNVPLEYQSVSFEFSITSPDGSCVLYREQKNGVDMRNSKGVFDSPIGAAGASKLFPSTPSFTLTDAFRNSGVLNCEGGLTYTPSVDDGRKLRVQFYDGTSWNLISPDTLIRSVPYALQAASAVNANVAQKLGSYSAGDFLRSATIPVCGAGYVLTSSTLGVLSCQDLSMTSVRPSGSAGGDLTGNYPNPTIAGNAVTTSKIADGAVTGNKLETLSVTAGAYGSSTQIPTITVDSKGRVTAISTSSISAMPSAGGGASGKFLKSDGTSWSAENVLVTDVKNSSGTAVFTLSACAANKALTWSAGTNTFVCQDIDGLAWSTITSGKPTTLSGYGITDAIKNAGSTVSIQSGADASKGAAGTDGRVYIATDSHKIYRDDGSTWVQIASNAGAGGTVTSVTAGTGLETAPGAGITTTGSIGIAVGGVTATELASNAVTTVKIANGNVTGAKLEDITTAGSYGSGTSVPAISVDAKGRVTSVTATAITGLLPDASVSSGKYLKSDGTNWAGQDIRFSDIKNSMGGSAFAAGISGCGDNQTVKWNVLTDTFNCQNIGSLDADKITTGVINPARLGTGTASSSTFLRGDGTWDAPTFTESDPKVGVNTTNYLSKWDGSKLVASTVIENSGKVGIGLSNPAVSLQVVDGSNTQVSIGPSTAASANAQLSLYGKNSGVANETMIIASWLGDMRFKPKAGQDITLEDGNGADILVAKGGSKRVGIVTGSPGSELDVNGTIRATAICDRSGTNCKTISGGWGGSGTVTSVTAGLPLVVTDSTTTPNITIPAATASADGYLKSADFTTFNSKLGAVSNTASLANTKIWVGDAGGKAQEQTPGGDVSMNASASFTVTKLQNRTVASTAPSLGTFLKWNNTLLQWEPFVLSTCSGVSQVMHYVSTTDTWTCDTLSVTSATGTLPIGNGGTGATTATAALNNLLPAQSGKVGQFLKTDGTNAAWSAVTATPAGNDTEIQYNNSGALGASTNFKWDKTNNRLDIGSGTVQNSVAGLNIAKSQNNETSIDLANATNGTAALTSINLYNNNGYQGAIATGSSTYATPGYKDRFVVESSSNAGGLTLRAGSATVGDIRFITGSWDERMRIDKDGKLGIGTTTPNFLVDVRQSDAEPVVSVQNSSSTSAHFPGFRTMNYMGSVGSGYAQFTVINGRGSDASPSPVQSGDTLGSFNFHGAKNTSWGVGLGASINAVATETYSNTANGGYLAFSTTNTGTTTHAERMRIGANGNVSIGNSSLGARLDVSSAGSAANETGFILRNPSTAAYATVNYDFYTAGSYKGSFWTMRDNTGSGGIFGISTANTSGVGAERMRIDQDGNMGLGMSPAGSARLSIGGSGTPLWINSTNSTETKITFADNGTQRGYIGASATKAFYVGGAGGAWMVLDTSGNLSISGTTYTPSDRRYKEKITVVEESLNKILTLHGVTYNWKPSTGKSADRQMGVIAQDVEKVFPEAVRTEDSGYKTVNYVALFAPVIESIKELYAKIVGHDQQLRQLASEKVDRVEFEALKKENEKLKEKNAEFEERLKRLESSR